MADQLHTSYTRAEARAVGMTRAQLRDDGIRVTRGGYVSRAVPLDVRAAGAVVLRVLPAGAALSHRTAAALLGAPVPRRFPVDVAVPPGATRARRDRVRVHVRTLTEQDLIRVDGLPVTSAAQTWLDLCGPLPPGELVAVGDALLRAGLLTAGALEERLDRADGLRGVVRARELAPLLTRHAASRPESLVLYLLLASALPDPEPNVSILDRRGRVVAHGDLGYPRWKVLLEYEGRQHAEPDQFDRDLDRYSLMAADGWLLLRFGRRHLQRPAVVLDRVGRALHGRGARW